MASQFVWLKPYRESLGNNKGELQKENIGKRSIFINRIKEFYENIPYIHIENIVKSNVTTVNYKYSNKN